MKFQIKSLLFAFALALASLTLSAQPPPDSTPQGDPVGEPTPIGGGLLVLLGLAGAYGAKKVYDARKKLSE